MKTIVEAMIYFSVFLLNSGLEYLYPKVHLGEGLISLYITIILVIYILVHEYNKQLQD